MEKKFCETHRLYYSGDVCPICQREKYERMSRKYNSQNNVNNDLEITNETIQMLRTHFSK